MKAAPGWDSLGFSQHIYHRYLDSVVLSVWLAMISTAHQHLAHIFSGSLQNSPHTGDSSDLGSVKAMAFGHTDTTLGHAVLSN